MRLKYRGQSYEYEPVDATVEESEMSGSYRWQSFQFSYPRHIPVPQVPHNCTYRGVDYQTDEVGEQSPVSFRRYPVAPVSSDARTSLKTRRAMMREVEQMHLENIQKRLQHRIEVAQARGDQALVAALEHEMSQMVCHI